MTANTATETTRHEVPGPRTITVHGSAAGFAQEIAIGQHRLFADEPASVGGNRHRSESIRPAPGRPRILHLDDCRDVRAPEALAA